MVYKNFWLGMLVIVLVFGMTVIGCKAQVKGTVWVESDGKDDLILEFSDPPNMTGKEGRVTSKGTYTISGNKITMTVFDETFTGEISGNKLLVNAGGETFEFTKVKK